MKKFNLHIWLLSYIALLHCTEGKFTPVVSSGGKVRAPISVESKTTVLRNGDGKITVQITPWETLDTIQCTLRAAAEFQQLSVTEKKDPTKASNPVELEYIIHMKRSGLKSVILDCELSASGQNYHSAHEILLSERNYKHDEKMKQGHRRIKEL